MPIASKKDPFSNVIKYIIVLEEGRTMDLVPLKKHSLTRAQFEQLADVPPEEEWLANITNLKTRRCL